MVYLIGQLWLYLIIALALGLGFGWWSCRNASCEGADRPSAPVWLVVLAFLVALVAAAIHWLRGNAGLWLDTALLLVAAYLIGCVIACVVCCWLNRGRNAAPVAAVPAAAPALPLARPYAFAAALSAGKLSLTGSVPSEAVRGDIIAAARAALPAATLSDTMSLAGGAPAAFAALATHGIGQLRHFIHGRVSLVDDALSVEGEVPDQNALTAADKAFAMLPQGGRLAAKAITIAAAAAPAPKPAPKVVETPAAAPVYEMPKVEGEDSLAGRRPGSLKAPRGGKADDLKKIRGIGKQNEGRLHGLGIWHFDQIAAWTADNALWVGSFLAFPGRIEREEWIKQAKVLASGGTTEFSQRVERGEVESSKDDGSKGQGNIEKVDTSKAKPGKPPKK